MWPPLGENTQIGDTGMTITDFGGRLEQVTQKYRHFRQSIKSWHRVTPEGLMCITKGFLFLTNDFP